MLLHYVHIHISDVFVLFLLPKHSEMHLIILMVFTSHFVTCYCCALFCQGVGFSNCTVVIFWTFYMLPLSLMLVHSIWCKKTPRTFACIIHRSSWNESVQKHYYM